MIGVSNDVIVTNPYEMDALEKRNPVWVSSMREYYVKTLLLIPLKRGKQIIGYLYAINFDVEKVFELKELAELMSHFVGTELSNHYMMDKLDAMSHTDALTGVGSRRAMLEIIEELNTMEPAFPYGIVNMDVNGLKKVNDEEGHEVGDQYIVRAAELMKRVFDPKTIYRSGGDEFIVILRDVSEKALEQKAEAMRQIQENDEQISIAVGEFWNDGTVPLQEALQEADNAMYEEKRKYHQKA
jgi:diguanylate cyclase (GGDEF)-like protein